MKFCRGCKQDVAKADFGNNKSQEGGLHWNCKECARIASKKSREKRKLKKLAELEACREEHLKNLSPKQRQMAEDIRRGRETRSVISQEPKSLEMCQTYVQKLRAQKRWMGSGFPRMTDESLTVWENRLKELMTDGDYKTFIENIT